LILNTLPYLRNEIEIGDQSRLENDWHVGGVEQLNRIRSLLATCILGSDRKYDSESLEVDNDEENQHSGEEVGDVREVLAVEGFTQSPHFVCPCYQQVEQGNDRSLKLRTPPTVNCCWAKSLPYDVLAAHTNHNKIIRMIRIK
jgi:hypothetical protein